MGGVLTSLTALLCRGLHARAIKFLFSIPIKLIRSSPNYAITMIEIFDQRAVVVKEAVQLIDLPKHGTNLVLNKISFQSVKGLVASFSAGVHRSRRFSKPTFSCHRPSSGYATH